MLVQPCLHQRRKSIESLAQVGDPTDNPDLNACWQARSSAQQLDHPLQHAWVRVDADLQLNPAGKLDAQRRT